MKCNVLVYEPLISNFPYLAFVMGVTQVGYTHAQSAAEAMNWLAAVKAKIVFYDLMLMSSLSHEESEVLLLEELPSLQIPVMFLQRDMDPPTILIALNAIICTPDNLIQCLHRWTTANAF